MTTSNSNNDLCAWIPLFQWQRTVKDLCFLIFEEKILTKLISVEVNTNNCACPIPCTASDFKYEISSAELSNNFVKNELKNGKQDPKFQDAIEKSRYQLLIHIDPEYPQS